MNLSCSDTLWSGDDFTACFYFKYLHFIIPLTTVILSLVLIFTGLLYTFIIRRNTCSLVNRFSTSSNPVNRSSQCYRDDPSCLDLHDSTLLNRSVNSEFRSSACQKNHPSGFYTTTDSGLNDTLHPPVNSATDSSTPLLTHVTAQSNVNSSFLSLTPSTSTCANTNFPLLPSPTTSKLSNIDGIVKHYYITRPPAELTITFVEGFCILLLLALDISYTVTSNFHPTLLSSFTGYCSLIFDIYLASVVSSRLFFSYHHRYTFYWLWYHTALLYAVNWIISILSLRSNILHPTSSFLNRYCFVHLLACSVLIGLSMSCRWGNRPVKIIHQDGLQPSIEPTASFFSLATFSWVTPIIRAGRKCKPFDMSKVWDLAFNDQAENILHQYRLRKRYTSLSLHLLKCFRGPLLLQAFFSILTGLLVFVPTLLVKSILQYIEQPNSMPASTAWLLVILLFVQCLVMAYADGQALWIGRKICIHLRAIIISEIYNKSLRRRIGTSKEKVLSGDTKSNGDGTSKRKGFFHYVRSLLSRNKNNESSNGKTSESQSSYSVSSGAIINLMAVDSFQVSELCAYLHFVWAGTPTQICISVYLLYRIIGLSSLASIMVILLLLPVNVTISRQFAKAQKQILAATDARTHITNEVLTNIRIIKFFSWERRFAKMIDEKRCTEMKNLRKRYLWWTIAATVWSGSPVLITFVSFYCYVAIQGKPLHPSIAFSVLSVIQVLQVSLDQLADMFAHVQEAKISVDRVDEFLNDAETDKANQLSHPSFENGQPVIGFDCASFTWGTAKCPSGAKTGSEGDTNESAGTAESFCLTDLDVRFKLEGLNIVVGSTGSGKSSLLLALLGEMTLLKGQVLLPCGLTREYLKRDKVTGYTDSVAYCSQQPWLINGSIRDNILFSLPYEAKRYEDVIKACSLNRDFEIFDAGDETLVGEKGVTLSGGQKQRVALARALYSYSKYILLDDVLSAIDSHTAKWVFEHAICGAVKAKRTCILVTHNGSLCLPRADFVVVMDGGKVVENGTFEEVVKREKIKDNFVFGEGEKEKKSADEDTIVDGGEDQNAEEGKDGIKAVNSSVKLGNTAETVAVGSVKLSVILFYMRSMGNWVYWILVPVIFGTQQLCFVGLNLWIRTWANTFSNGGTKVGKQNGLIENSVSRVVHFSNFDLLTNGWSTGIGRLSGIIFGGLEKEIQQNQATGGLVRVEKHGTNLRYYLTVYALLGLITTMVAFIHDAMVFYGSLSASRKIHDKLVHSVLRAKFRFFDSTPLGQIMNRFSRDIESVDQEVASCAIGVIRSLSATITIVILISVITPEFLIACVFIIAMYYFIGSYYISSSRDLKRLESVQRSPLYQQIGETLSGVVTIRAFGDEDRFSRDNLRRINTQARPFIYLWATNRWLAFRVDVVGGLVAFSAGCFVLLKGRSIDAGAAGLALTYAITFTENVLWVVRLYASNEQNMNSVERIKEYLNVDQEAAAIVEGFRPAKDWPSRGRVEFINFSTRYSIDSEDVLKNLTLVIEAGEKLGIVGRTGAGKSSFALALFRALEARQGKILIDGIDISRIGLQDLREHLVMVPQDATLFAGTIRSNLDPFNLLEDSEIFSALRRVHLIGDDDDGKVGQEAEGSNDEELNKRQVNGGDKMKKIKTDKVINQGGKGGVQCSEGCGKDEEPAEKRNMFLDLNTAVTEQGANLSHGQKQLLCLARALLKKPKILLMDEATASIDNLTDTKIQDTIRQLESTTTITIAHRLRTIIDYDKVLVLEHGRMLEYGEPSILLNDSKTSFYKMCAAASDFGSLRHEANRATQARRAAQRPPPQHVA